MKTKFQKTLPDDKNTLWEIVKIFHPDIPDTVTYHTKKQGEVVKNTIDLITTSLRYDWVTIFLKVNGYGTVSIGIDNGDHPFFGKGITRDMFQKAYDNKQTSIHCWRFYDDLRKDEFETCSREYYAVSKQAADYLLSKGYQVQSVNEMYYLYYKD